MQDILDDLIEDMKLSESTDELQIIADGGSRYIKDFRLNFKKILKEKELDMREISLLGLALAVNHKNSHLRSFFKELCENNDVEREEQAEAISCASLLASNNVLYRFRHFVNTDEYNKLPAKIRMNIMKKPVIGKNLFELISLAVSAVNGCETCVQSHEASLRKLDVDTKKIWAAIRMASVIMSADRLLSE